MPEKVWLVALAVGLGALAGYAHYAGVGISLPMLLLALSGLLLGGLAPREAWLWAALLGLSILSAYGVSSFFGVTAGDLVLLMALPLVSALLGTVLGLFVRGTSVVTSPGARHE